MAITIAEADKLSNNVLLQGVFETILNDDPLAELLQWVPVIGNSLTYNRENAAAGAAWYDVGETWVEQTPTFTELTAKLKIVGGDADVDNFLKITRRNPQDLATVVLQLKAKATWDEIRDTLINGDNAANSKRPDGMKILIPSGQEVFSNGDTAGNGATLTLASMDRLHDQVRGNVDFYLMSRRSRRKLTALFRASGSGVVPIKTTEFGVLVPTWDGAPIFISDYVSITETVGSSTDCSTIYAVHTGEDGLVGLTGLPDIFTIEDVGNLETKDASRARVKSYVSFALFASKSCAKLTGVRD